MHDWWAALLCSATGDIIDIDEQLIGYRLHDSNFIGLHTFFRKVFNAGGFSQLYKKEQRHFSMLFHQALAAERRLLFHGEAKGSTALLRSFRELSNYLLGTRVLRGIDLSKGEPLSTRISLIVKLVLWRPKVDGE